MPSRKSQRNNKGVRSHCVHNEAYWERLRRDFKTCSYHGGGAYTLTEQRTRGDTIDTMREQIDRAERLLKGRALNRRKSRLDNAVSFSRTQAPLDESS